ncbi:MAG TPA: SIS domain-containing protein [Rubrobacteraceae bacterium]|nr:SIS domain-containing protein [Rubrobacteraceae bacterium]
MEQRKGHPYHMHDAIRAQPEAFVRVLEKNAAGIDAFAAGAASSERLFLVGIGTSYHAARAGEHLFREYAGSLDVRAVHSFDFALYGPDLAPHDCVVLLSHRGTKRYTALALQRASEAGCRTALVTGESDRSRSTFSSTMSHLEGSLSAGSHAVFETVEQERSAAHTVSYTGAVSVLAYLAGRFGRYREGSGTLSETFLRDELPEALRSALGMEGEVERLAREHLGRRRIWLAGAGPSAVVAEEVALKIKETSYLQAEGMSTETMLHGPFQCVEDEDLFVLVAPGGGPAGVQERTLEVAELAAEIGAACFIVGDGSEQAVGMVHLSVSAVPEPFGALTCLVPLQLFAYRLALARGTNPDSFRAEDSRFARADVSGRL